MFKEARLYEAYSELHELQSNKIINDMDALCRVISDINRLNDTVCSKIESNSITDKDVTEYYSKVDTALCSISISEPMLRPDVVLLQSDISRIAMLSMNSDKTTFKKIYSKVIEFIKKILDGIKAFFKRLFLSAGVKVAIDKKNALESKLKEAKDKTPSIDLDKKTEINIRIPGNFSDIKSYHDILSVIPDDILSQMNEVNDYLRKIGSVIKDGIKLGRVDNIGHLAHLQRVSKTCSGFNVNIDDKHIRYTLAKIKGINETKNISIGVSPNDLLKLQHTVLKLVSEKYELSKELDTDIDSIFKITHDIQSIDEDTYAIITRVTVLYNTVTTFLINSVWSNVSRYISISDEIGRSVKM